MLLCPLGIFVITFCWGKTETQDIRGKIQSSEVHPQEREGSTLWNESAFNIASYFPNYLAFSIRVTKSHNLHFKQSIRKHCLSAAFSWALWILLVTTLTSLWYYASISYTFHLALKTILWGGDLLPPFTYEEMKVQRGSETKVIQPTNDLA